MSDPFASGGGGMGQQETIIIAMCCCSSMAVALFLFYAYKNQEKFEWLDWFFKIFKKGEGTSSTPTYSDVSSGDPPPGTELPPPEGDYLGIGDPVPPVPPNDKPGPNPGPRRNRTPRPNATACKGKNTCSKVGNTKGKGKNCKVCKKNTRTKCLGWEKAPATKCKGSRSVRVSRFTPMAPMEAYDPPFDNPFRAPYTVPSAIGATGQFNPAAPVPYNERV